MNPGHCLSFRIKLGDVALKRFSKFRICFLDLLRARWWSFGERVICAPTPAPGSEARGWGGGGGSGDQGWRGVEVSLGNSLHIVYYEGISYQVPYHQTKLSFVLSLNLSSLGTVVGGWVGGTGGPLRS